MVLVSAKVCSIRLEMVCDILVYLPFQAVWAVLCQSNTE